MRTLHDYLRLPVKLRAKFKLTWVFGYRDLTSAELRPLVGQLGVPDVKMAERHLNEFVTNSVRAKRGDWLLVFNVNARNRLHDVRWMFVDYQAEFGSRKKYTVSYDLQHDASLVPFNERGSQFRRALRAHVARYVNLLGDDEITMTPGRVKHLAQELEKQEAREL